MHISLLSVIAKTLEKSLLPYITANIPNTPTQRSTILALHTLNNAVAKGFNQMTPPARTITVTLDMSKTFNTINIHKLIRKLLQTNIPGTLIKNYTFTKSTTNHIHHHYAPSVTHTRDPLSIQQHPHMHYVVTTEFVDRPRWSDATDSLMDGGAGWWTTNGKIGLPLLAGYRECVDNNSNNKYCLY